MSGSKTRFGFMGGDDPPDTEEAKAARTVLGHDVHLQMPPDLEPPRFPVAHTPVPPALTAAPTPPPAPSARATPPRATVRVEDLEQADPRRQHLQPQPSRLARFLGRWTRSGRFVSSHGRPHSKRKSTVRIPRDTAGRNLLLVLLVAFFAFIVTLIVVRMRERVSAPPPPPSVPAPVATPPPSLAPTAAPAPRPPPAAARERPPAEVSAPSRPVPAAAKGLGNPGAGPRRAQYPGRPMAQPPDHLKGELLPLNPPIEPYAP